MADDKAPHPARERAPTSPQGEVKRRVTDEELVAAMKVFEAALEQLPKNAPPLIFLESTEGALLVAASGAPARDIRGFLSERIIGDRVYRIGDPTARDRLN